jgi:hypothetical protein
MNWELRRQFTKRTKSRVHPVLQSPTHARFAAQPFRHPMIAGTRRLFPMVRTHSPSPHASPRIRGKFLPKISMRDTREVREIRPRLPGARRRAPRHSAVPRFSFRNECLLLSADPWPAKGQRRRGAAGAARQLRLIGAAAMLHAIGEAGVHLFTAEVKVRLARMAQRPLADLLGEVEQARLVRHFRAGLGGHEAARRRGRDRLLLFARTLAQKAARPDGDDPGLRGRW